MSPSPLSLLRVLPGVSCDSVACPREGGTELCGPGGGVVSVCVVLALWLIVRDLATWGILSFFLFSQVIVSHHVVGGCVTPVTPAQLHFHFQRSSVLAGQGRTRVRSSALVVLITEGFPKDFHGCSGLPLRQEQGKAAMGEGERGVWDKLM